MVHGPETAKAFPPGQAGLDAALTKAGGGAALARALGVTKGAVQQWKQAGIPASRVPAVARLTGIPMRELRPDLFDEPVHAADPDATAAAASPESRLEAC